jgi:alkylation response protein AidB-like acyl-CoA dehydrogenase
MDGERVKAAQEGVSRRFFLDMRSPGIEVRRIKQISGASNFNEVFFTDLRIPTASASAPSVRARACP